MKDINKIIDSLSPGEQNVMYNALQKRLNRGPEYTIRKNGLRYSIKLKDKYENADHGTICSLAFETSEMAHLAYAIYLNTQNSFADIILNTCSDFLILIQNRQNKLVNYVLDR